MNGKKNYTRKEFFGAAVDGARDVMFQFLRGYGEAARAFEETASRKTAAPSPEWLRPPGALPEAEFLAACTRCDECVKQCPPMVIRKAGPEMGDIGGTPVILPKDNPCDMCEGWPCIAVCEPGALVPPKSDAVVRIGTLRVDENACYLAQRQPCDYCQVHCPEKPKAILAQIPGQAPEIKADACTGCGKCLQICPADALHLERLEA